MLVSDVAELARAVARRPTSLFNADHDARREEVAALLRDRSVLVVGGAGTIGSATVREIAPYDPRQLHVVDIDENALTELVRDLRSRAAVSPSTQLRTTPLDAASPTMRRLIEDNGGYDYVFNFAAVKHVRSEKDVYSLLRMLDINVRLPRRLLEWVGDSSQRYFAVSTDKAANPVNLMGASKRAMEHLILDEAVGPAVCTARFANVAFSQGSLLDGWLRRLSKHQPLTVPAGARRYFVTPEEAGQLCLLAGTLGPAGGVVIPVLDPERELRDLVQVAEEVLSAFDLKPNYCASEDEARYCAQHPEPGVWPVLVTALDTVGEKEFEEFVADGEKAATFGLGKLQVLQPPRCDPLSMSRAVRRLSTWLDDADAPVRHDEAVAMLTSLVPELRHRESELALDDRM